MFWKPLQLRCLEAIVRESRCVVKSGFCLGPAHRGLLLGWLAAHGELEDRAVVDSLVSQHLSGLELDSASFTDEFLEWLATSPICDQLESLNLCFSFRSLDSGVEALLSRLAHLKTLELKELKLDRDPFLKFHSDRLEELSLQLYVRNYEWSGLNNLILKHNELKRISISTRGRTLPKEDQLLLNITQSVGRCLVELELNNFASEKASLSALLLGCRELKRLKLAGSLQFDLNTMVQASEICRWEALEVTFQVTPPKETYEALQYLPESLQELGFKFGPSNRNMIVSSILKLPHITKLRYHTEFFNDALTERLLSGVGSQLKSLDIGLCETLTDVGLGSVADHCGGGELQTLYIHSDMNRCNRVCTGMPLIRMIQQPICAKKLRVLYLNHFKPLTFEFLYAVAVECKWLEELYLRGVRAVSDAILEVLSENCKLLNSLDVSQCWAVTDKGIVSVSAELPLKYLNIAMCIRITTASIQALSKNCLFLEHLICNGTPNVNKESIEVLKYACFKRLKNYYYHWFS